MTQEEEFILLVEDTLTQAMLYQHSFEKAGIKTKVAKSSKKAFEILEASKPILVLSDVNMPDETGYQLCSKIKSSDTTSDIMVVLISSVLNSDEIFEIVECGADDFILKSLEPEAITRHLKRSIDQAKNQKSLENGKYEGSVYIDGQTRKMKVPSATADKY